MTSTAACVLAADAVAASESVPVPVRSRALLVATPLHSMASALMYVSPVALVTPKEIVSDPAEAFSLSQISTALLPLSMIPTDFVNAPLTLPVTEVNPLPKLLQTTTIALPAATLGSEIVPSAPCVRRGLDACTNATSYPQSSVTSVPALICGVTPLPHTILGEIAPL